MKLMKLAVATALLAGTTNAVAAPEDTTQRDAKCYFVKSKILDNLQQDEDADEEVISGIISHMTYFYGRLRAKLDDSKTNSLIVEEALKFEEMKEVIAAEEACDAHMIQIGDDLESLGEALRENGR